MIVVIGIFALLAAAALSVLIAWGNMMSDAPDVRTGYGWPIAIAIVGLILLAIPRALGAPPPGVDLNSPRAKWFESLKQPGTGIGCCSVADCRTYAQSDVRVGPKGYEIRYEGRWLPVPNDKILQGKVNPMGRPVACVVAGEVWCFVRGAET